MKKTRFVLVPAALAVSTLLALTGCGGSQEASHDSSSKASASSGANSSDSGLAVKDPWAKAADSGMTAVFGTLTNTSDHEVKVTQAETQASDMAQLHETVTDSKTGASSMQEKKDGFTIKPGESLDLKPGGNHIMLMDLKCSMLAGDSLKVTLKTSDDKSLVVDAPIRDYSGAKENYDPSEESGSSSEQTSDHDMSDHSGHDMNDHSGHDMSSMSPSSSKLPSCSS
ncbi:MULTISPECIES: copper chaperone PCu(A)C [Micrococcaceae]|uniref:copper chaperone PCu(A)C n=1 Tax=unclassified Kocuria TaxID=2649579 RepID=UPI00101160A8|nr:MULTISPECIES: copper chaperone PCu(A)C [unclassified Kocuria]